MYTHVIDNVLSLEMICEAEFPQTNINVPRLTNVPTLTDYFQTEDIFASLSVCIFIALFYLNRYSSQQHILANEYNFVLYLLYTLLLLHIIR